MATAINLAGTKVLAAAAIAGFAAELVGALAVGIWLLVAHREQTLSILTDTFETGGEGGYLAAFLAAGLIGIYQYYGFEACGDVAEEVPNPGKRIPTSMRRTIYIGGAAAIFVTLALLLAVSDYAAVFSGEDADPVGTVMVERLRRDRHPDSVRDHPAVVRLLRHEPAGCGQPADLLLRPRRHDPGQLVPEEVQRVPARAAVRHARRRASSRP